MGLTVLVGESKHIYRPRVMSINCLLLFLDINECLERGGTTGHHCNMNTNCVNVYGSFECECKKGYARSDKWNCVEIDECATEQHECDENAICSNTQGSYECTCGDGFSGDGKECKPVCDPNCLNGGDCVGPQKCECRLGYEGERCEKDLDEW
jgi:protein kinase C-binding protein NELL